LQVFCALCACLVGEALAGRRGGIRTSGTFKVNLGGRGNRAGNDEAEMDLGEVRSLLNVNTGNPHDLVNLGEAAGYGASDGNGGSAGDGTYGDGGSGTYGDGAGTYGGDGDGSATTPASSATTPASSATVPASSATAPASSTTTPAGNSAGASSTASSTASVSGSSTAANCSDLIVKVAQGHADAQPCSQEYCIFNSDNFGEETKGEFDKNDVETYISRIYPKGQKNHTCGFRLKTPKNMLETNEGTHPFCIVTSAPSLGFVGGQYANEERAMMWPFPNANGPGFKLNSNDVDSVLCLTTKVPKDVLAPNNNYTLGTAKEMKIGDGLVVQFRVMKISTCIMLKSKEDESQCAERKLIVDCKTLTIQGRECNDKELSLVAMRG